MRLNKNFSDKMVKEKVILQQSRVICVLMKMTASEDIQTNLNKYIEHGAKIMSDEWLGYNGLEEFYNHTPVFHQKKKIANGETCTNRIEGFWAIVK